VQTPTFAEISGLVVKKALATTSSGTIIVNLVPHPPVEVCYAVEGPL